MGTKVRRLGVKRKSGYLYYVDKDGDICEAKQGIKSKKVVIVGIKKEKGHLYYLDKDGDMAKTEPTAKKKKA